MVADRKMAEAEVMPRCGYGNNVMLCWANATHELRSDGWWKLAHACDEHAPLVAVQMTELNSRREGK